MHDIHSREIKAQKTISVLRDYFDNRHIYLNNLTLLDIGSSRGVMTKFYSQHFKNVVGIDIDKEAFNLLKLTIINRMLNIVSWMQ